MVVARLFELLSRLGFQCTLWGSLLVARRRATTQPGVVVYNHYDTANPEGGWSTPPFELVDVNGRLVGLGVADNKGALAARLAAFAQFVGQLEVTWLIQGEEETGGVDLRRYLNTHPGSPQAVWIDENGWSRRGRQQLLHSGEPGPLDALKRSLAEDGELVSEQRVLNKQLVPGGCAFQAAVPGSASYVAFGLNDDESHIHSPNESILSGALAQHERQFGRALQLLASR